MVTTIGTALTGKRTPSSGLLEALQADWLAEADRVDAELRRKLRRSERDDEFRQRMTRRSNELFRVAAAPSAPSHVKLPVNPMLAEWHEQAGRERSKTHSARARITAREPIENWIARRFVRMAFAFRKYLESQHRTYRRPWALGRTAELAYWVVEHVADTTFRRSAMPLIQERLAVELRITDEWLARLHRDPIGTNFLYLVSTKLWADLLDAAEAPQSVEPQVRAEEPDSNLPGSTRRPLPAHLWRAETALAKASTYLADSDDPLAAWSWLREHGCDEYGEDNPLPSSDTWLRYVREARRRQRVGGRP